MRRLRYARWPLRAGAPCEDEYVASRSQERVKRSENSRDVVWTGEKEMEEEEERKEKESRSDAETDEKKGKRAGEGEQRRER